MATTPTAGIAVIGNEILSGKFADENSPFLIKELRELGVRLERIVVLPDVASDIAATVRGLSERLDHVFTSGGVGPTHDDVTMAGIALGFGVELETLPGLVDLLRTYYKTEPTGAHLRLAEAPAGAELVYGDDPMWPVTMFRNITILPGVPPLFRKKFTSVRERYRAARIHTERVYVAADETAIADRLTAVTRAHPDIEIGSYPRFEDRRFKVILTVEGTSPEAVAAAAVALGETFADILTTPEPDPES